MAALCFPLNAVANDKLYGYTPVSNKYDLMNVYKNPNGNYYLTDDIVFLPKDYIYGSEFLNFYESSDFKNSEFYGTFDGCGHTISGTEYPAIARYNYGTISNVLVTDCSSDSGLLCNENHGKVVNCKIDSCNGYGLAEDNYGEIEYCYSENSSCGICNLNEDTGIIEYCINYSDIDGNDYSYNIKNYYWYKGDDYYTGGIVNYNRGIVYRCINNGNINSTSSSHNVGGICGYADSKIEECINNGMLTATHGLNGGICGNKYTYSDVINCLNTGTVESGYGISIYCEPICCVNLGNSNVAIGGDSNKYCYYLEGTGNDSDAVCLSATDIGKESSYEKFNFEKVWKIADGKPTLQFADEEYTKLVVYDYPSKLVYNEGEAFNNDDLLVMSVTNKGQWKFINDYTISGFTGTKGINTVKISSNNVDASFKVIVYQSINESVFKQKNNSFTATGKALTPGVTVISPEGNLLTLGKDYKISYKNNINPGIATMSISGTGFYNGTVNKTFYITPMKTSELKVKSKALNSLTLSWKKQSGVDGYIVQQYNNKTNEYKTIKTITTNSAAISSLRAGTQYKYRVCSYKKADGKTFHGAYSDVLIASTKVKKPAKVKGVTSVIKVDDKKLKVKYTAKWKKVKGASGYQIKFGTYDYIDKHWLTTKTVKGASKTSYKTNFRYGTEEGYDFVKVRAYKMVNGKKVYGKWSKVVYSTQVNIT